MSRFVVTAIVLLAWVPAALAQPPVWNEMRGEEVVALQATGDPSRGAALFVPCRGCHRAGAVGRSNGSYPRLAGQHATVLIKQMTDMRAGRRDNPKMAPFIDDHAVPSPLEIADLAAYLSQLPIPATNGKGPGTHLERGKRLYFKDCATCHGDEGAGDARKFYPMVAAQHYRYLLREERFIRDGRRHNANPDMVKAIGPYSDADMEAVADFLSRLPPPNK